VAVVCSTLLFSALAHFEEKLKFELDPALQLAYLKHLKADIGKVFFFFG
jgi:hypothetical protein